MIKDLLKGFYFGIGLFLFIGILFGIVWASGWHTADEIFGGTFLGNYKFTGNLLSGDINCPFLSWKTVFNNTIFIKKNEKYNYQRHKIMIVLQHAVLLKYQEA